MSDYEILFTDSSVTPITVAENSVDRSSVGVSLIGRIFQNYGEDVNTTLLNILENFACPESDLSTDIDNSYPDITQTTQSQLTNPIEGQLWYNSTRKTIYYFDSVEWIPIYNRGIYAANWGTILHGNVLPKPVNQTTGQVFDYDECIWSVSPAYISGFIDGLNCNTDSNALVTMQYRYSETDNFIDGVANYLIIGIKGNTNNGVYLPPLTPPTSPLPTPDATPTLTPTPTASVTPTQGVSVTPTISNTPVASVTPTPMPTPPVTQTRTPLPTVGITPTRTGTPVGTPAVTPTRTETPVVTPTGTPASTPDSTPPVTPTPSPVPVVNLECVGTATSSSLHGEGSEAEAFFVLGGDGTCALIGSTSGNQTGRWLTGGDASSYEVRVTQTAYNPTGPGVILSRSGPMDTWVNLGSGVSWSAKAGPTQTQFQSASIEWGLNVQIKHTASGTIVGNGDILLTVYVGMLA